MTSYSVKNPFFEIYTSETYLGKDDIGEGVCLLLQSIAEVLIASHKVLQMAINGVLDERSKEQLP